MSDETYAEFRRREGIDPPKPAPAVPPSHHFREAEGFQGKQLDRIEAMAHEKAWEHKTMVWSASEILWLVGVAKAAQTLIEVERDDDTNPSWHVRWREAVDALAAALAAAGKSALTSPEAHT